MLNLFGIYRYKIKKSKYIKCNFYIIIISSCFLKIKSILKCLALFWQGSVHLDVFIIKLNGNWIKSVYLAALDKCDNDMIDTLVIAKIDLQQFNKDFPHITLYTLYVKSENAGCYHSSSTIEALIHLCNQLNIKIKRYDFPSRSMVRMHVIVKQHTINACIFNI